MRIANAKARTCQNGKSLPLMLIVTYPVPLKYTKQLFLSMYGVKMDNFVRFCTDRCQECEQEQKLSTSIVKMRKEHKY